MGERYVKAAAVRVADRGANETGGAYARMVAAAVLWTLAAGLLVGYGMMCEGDAANHGATLFAVAGIGSVLVGLARTVIPRVSAGMRRGIALVGALLLVNLLVLLFLAPSGGAGIGLARLCAVLAGALASGALVSAVSAAPAHLSIAAAGRGGRAGLLFVGGSCAAACIGGCIGVLVRGAIVFWGIDPLVVTGLLALNATLAAAVMACRNPSRRRCADGRPVQVCEEHPARSIMPGAARDLRDLTAKKCALLCGAYGLSEREGEVAERMARGQTVPYMACELGISPNTVRMHSKHIYSKLGIHKRQELLDLLERF